MTIWDKKKEDKIYQWMEIKRNQEIITMNTFRAYQENI